MRFDLIWKSRGESKPKEGERLTSRIHGLRSESSIISNPKRSKQLALIELPPEFYSFFVAETMWFSTLIIDFMIES